MRSKNTYGHRYSRAKSGRYHNNFHLIKHHQALGVSHPEYLTGEPCSIPYRSFLLSCLRLDHLCTGVWDPPRQADPASAGPDFLLFPSTPASYPRPQPASSTSAALYGEGHPLQTPLAVSAGKSGCFGLAIDALLLHIQPAVQVPNSAVSKIPGTELRQITGNSQSPSTQIPWPAGANTTPFPGPAKRIRFSKMPSSRSRSLAAIDWERVPKNPEGESPYEGIFTLMWPYTKGFYPQGWPSHIDGREVAALVGRTKFLIPKEGARRTLCPDSSNETCYWDGAPLCWPGTSGIRPIHRSQRAPRQTCPTSQPPKSSLPGTSRHTEKA